ncbi:MAG: hypothetical protein M3281_08125 [Chloroflexota bacterium]|nr:hypothetical protein [Chloroflexota bacterium]
MSDMLERLRDDELPPRPPGSGRQDDPSFGTSQQPNPLAAEDLEALASQAPREDKQGDVQPASD